MNTRLRQLMVLACFFATVVYADSQDYIVPNGITYSSAGSSAVIHVLQNPTNGDYTGFILRPEFKTPPNVCDTIFLFSTLPDEGVRTFLTSANDPISLQSIEAGSYLELSARSFYGFDLDVPFYLGVYTGYTNGAPAGSYINPVFGWAEFVNHQGVIQLLDSALVMTGGGIYVGTQTVIPVPEPGILSLFVVGAFTLGYRAKRPIKSLQATPIHNIRRRSEAMAGQVASRQRGGVFVRRRGYAGQASSAIADDVIRPACLVCVPKLFSRGRGE